MFEQSIFWYAQIYFTSAKIDPTQTRHWLQKCAFHGILVSFNFLKGEYFPIKQCGIKRQVECHKARKILGWLHPDKTTTQPKHFPFDWHWTWPAAFQFNSQVVVIPVSLMLKMICQFIIIIQKRQYQIKCEPTIDLRAYNSVLQTCTSLTWTNKTHIWTGWCHFNNAACTLFSLCAWNIATIIAIK